MQRAFLISVIVVAQRREEALRRCLRALERFGKNTEWELLLVLNSPSPAVTALAQSVQKYGQVRLLQAEALLPGAARNLALSQANGEVLFFLDDDTELFQDSFTALYDIFSDPAIGVAGGANLTPPGSGVLARATGQALASFWGGAWMRGRYRASAQRAWVGEESLILCNLAIRKSLFRRRQFPQHFVCGEENAFLLSLAADGTAKFVYDPRLSVYHERRACWRQLGFQAFRYGLGRAQGLHLVKPLKLWRFFLPAAFLLYQLLILIGASAVPLVLYFGLALAASIHRFVETRDLKASLLQPAATWWIHNFYAVGFVRGLCASRFFFFARRQAE